MSGRKLNKNWTKNFFVIDWETYYDKDYSIRGNVAWNWVKDERFDPFCVAIHCDDFSFSGPPEGFDWKLTKGRTAIAHNRNFDQPVTEEAEERGLIPKLQLKGWTDTAAMSSYFQLGRALKDAYRGLYEEEMNKDVRDYMKGKRWADFIAEDKVKEVVEYALQDALCEWRLFKDLYPRWPEIEEKIENLTSEMGKAGLPVDVPMIENSIESLDKQMWDAKNRLPWFNEIDPDTKKPYVIYSKKALGLECRKRDIPMAPSLAKDSAEFKQWMEDYGNKMSFVVDMQNYTRMNTHLQRLKTMESRVNSDDRMQYNLKYYGAEITGRFSGDAGFNVQNMPRDTLYGVNIRNCIRAPKGKQLLVADLCQIETRLQWWVAGDADALGMLEDGTSPYEAHARLTMGWTGGLLKKEDPSLYLLAKTRVLQLGYGCGWHKFWETVRGFGRLDILEGEYDVGDRRRFLNFIKTYQPRMVNKFENEDKDTKRHWVNAFIQVMDYREKNPGIKAQWDMHGAAFKKLNTGGTYKVPIADGRTLKFWNIREEKDWTSAKVTKGGKRRSKFYGANLFQNVIQALARSIFCGHMVELNERGYKIVLQVHDELVLEVDDSKVKQATKDVEEVMTTPPDWCECPLDCEYSIMERYTK